MDLNGLSSQVSGKIPTQPLVPPRTAMDRCGRVWAAYGSRPLCAEPLRDPQCHDDVTRFLELVCAETTRWA